MAFRLQGFRCLSFFQIMATLPALQESGIWVGKRITALMLTGLIISSVSRTAGLIITSILPFAANLTCSRTIAG